jgi:uncharacterized protein (TIGR02145 family)
MKCRIKISSITVLLLTSAFLIVSCKKASLPSVTTGIVNRILQTSANSGGQVISDGNAYITARGVCWDIATDPTVDKYKTSDSTGSGLFTSHLTGLTPSTVYYLRAYATNSEGTAYGDPVTFTTIPVSYPYLTTKGLKSVTLTTADGGGDISNDGGVPVIVRGVCWSTTHMPTIADSFTSDGSGDGMFSSTLTDLTLNTVYHVRAYATNSFGTGYGDEVEFIQIEPVLDYDGNAYSVVTIGTQVWMGENLKTTTYKDGIAIPNVVDGNEWAFMTTPAFCWYNNNETDFKATYGGLYNWHAVNTGKLCPAGWHVPTNDEFTTLIAFLGGDNVAGNMLKEAGTAHWAAPNLNASNGSGFTALPAGGRYNIYSSGGAFADLGYYGYWWTSSASTSASNAFSYALGFNVPIVGKFEYPKSDGYSVRCIRDTH